MKLWLKMNNQDTQKNMIIRGEANQKGWRDLTWAEGELISGAPPTAAAKSILSLIHISDLHICDAQSPARLEVLDRYADPHNPTSEFIKLVGNYRAQEILTLQTLDCMVQTINNIKTSPLSGREIDSVVITGDVIDNAQRNELNWYKTLLDGGEVNPNSGLPEVWEGAATADASKYDRSYWNPEGTPNGEMDDFPRSLYGFPTIPGLMKAIMRRFRATGLIHKWLAVHGNHDAMLQGTVPPDSFLHEFVIGNSRVAKLKEDADLTEIFSDYQMVGPATYPPTSVAVLSEITPDESRRFIDRNEWINSHIDCGHDHGIGKFNIEKNVRYWSKDIDQVRILALDTVNENGGWQGSIDETQFEWLKSQLQDIKPKYFILLSHHPSETLFNDYEPNSNQRRICEEELLELLGTDSRIILWLAGHTHTHKIEEKRSIKTGNSFWHIQTASNIDWPQQGRIVDIFEDGTRVVIATTVFDHKGELNLEVAKTNLQENSNLAGISRILAANDWQRRSGDFDLAKLAGNTSDRNTYLWI